MSYWNCQKIDQQTLVLYIYAFHSCVHKIKKKGNLLQLCFPGEQKQRFL